MRMPTRTILSLVLVLPYFQRCSRQIQAQSIFLARSAARSPIRLAQSSPEQPSPLKTRSAGISARQRRIALDGFSSAIYPLTRTILRLSATGFGGVAQDADVRSAVPVSMNIALKLAGASTTVTVQGSEDLLENDPTFHTDVDRGLFQKLPLESQSSSLSSLVTLSSPGVAADSNGLFHGLGDHASNSFSVDGQPITDQQSKVFSNQLPSNSIQSIEVISGAPPAEYGGKTSLVIVATTRSGQGLTKPTGDFATSYGTFGSATGSFDFGYGGKNWGNFVEFDGLNTGRFLDPPEFVVFHDKGNEENAFDRVDYQFTAGGFRSFEPELQPLLVPDSERLR